ncbi:hypothetical protein [Mycolicibacterium aichiense]|uniref:Uncharacterized protein n=2 Tax=Mycolicibacterium TaxID=1866885 RepID=A0AAD1HS04_9MYCO|nr:hypothetical protein [Mycolicibacterium aichiense]MCV7016333.1 hypothetical protein [Mycolicibacterium aichiense]BBX09894.1 hypothetical protein MAIC_46970 [Mycolicibacterium aichiense]STZ26439.1 Uncharacterised protein [Mycolicibacterium aichiense]
MVAIGAGGLSPGRFLSRVAAWLRAPVFAEQEPRGKNLNSAPPRAGFVEHSRMSREMYRL